MPNINLNLSKKLFVPKFFPYLTDYSHRWEIYKGSAGSAKSYFITQKLIIRACSERIRILVCRRYQSTIRNTCFALFKEILEKWQIKQYCKIRETDFNIQFPNGSEIIFLGLDEETKLLSLANIGTIFIEEVFEVPQSMVEQLNLRMRANVANQQIIMAFNPISKDSWLYDFCEVRPPQSCLYVQSTYEDNPFLSQEYVASLEELKVRNPAKAKIYCYGEWGVPAEGLVFTNWREEAFSPVELAQKHFEHRVGLDFGYIDPSVVVQSFYDKENKTIYVFDEYYRSGIQLDILANYLTDAKLNKVQIWCDSAEPRSIDFLRHKGFNTVPCIKGQDSVKARIAFLQNNTIIVHPHCQNVLRELANFSYIKDRYDKYTDKTTHEFSHTLDALGYAYSNIYKNDRLRTMDKSILGL